MSEAKHYDPPQIWYKASRYAFNQLEEGAVSRETAKQITVTTGTKDWQSTRTVAKHSDGRDWYPTRVEAITRIREVAAAKLASAQRQLEIAQHNYATAMELSDEPDPPKDTPCE